MSLYKKITGKGEPLVLIPGWGFSHRVFDPLVEKLSSRFECWQIDLPGIGESAPWREESSQEWPVPPEFQQNCGGYSVARLFQVLSGECPEQFQCLGWSLGGMIAIALASVLPQRISRVMTVASNPKFVATEDWPGVEAVLLKTFHQRLVDDPKAILRDFVLIQTQGMADSRSWFKTLMAQLAETPKPDPQALEFGLLLLEQWDLRARVSQLRMPQKHIFGRRDALVPNRVCEKLAPHSVLFENSAHMPFLTEMDRFLEVCFDE